MSLYRLRIEEIKGAEVVTSYTRWLERVQARGAENQEVYLTFSPSFERIWGDCSIPLTEYFPFRVGPQLRHVKLSAIQFPVRHSNALDFEPNG
jgi:hypothetical protein